MLTELFIIASLETQIVAEVLKPRLENHGIAVKEGAAMTLFLELDKSLEPDTYVMEDVQGGCRLRAPALAELFNGAGRFLHESRYTANGMEPWSGRGMFKLFKPLRAIYFATHFFNFYHVAPMEEIKTYLEDLALWGFNTLAFWYDLHHFHSFDDPDAVAFRERLTGFANIARSLGMKLFYLIVSNEAYADSPAELRAIKEGGARGGWYDSQICPSKPGGMDYLKEQFEQNCRGFIASLKPDYVTIWPYDQGGCGCELCKPWGGNAYLKIYEAFRPIGEKYFPQAKWIVSFWFCNDEEWRLGLEKRKNNPDYCEYIMEEIPVFKERPPKGTPLLGFPEISMNQSPWGGFGIAPQPNRYQKQWDDRKAELSGGYPYSEGIFEDLHKAMFAQFYSYDRPALETIRIYAAYHFGENVADQVVDLTKLLEMNHDLPRKAGWFLDTHPTVMDWLLKNIKPLEGWPHVKNAYGLAKAIDAQLPDDVRASWRWRIILLRTVIDMEFAEHGGLPTAACDKAFAELIQIYHAQSSHAWVKPPVSKRYKP